MLDLAPLRRHRELRLLLTGSSVSMLGSMVTSVAVPYQVYRISHSTLAVGALGLLDIAAILLLAFVGGALADAIDRRRMVRLTEAALLLGSAGLLANAVVHGRSLLVLFAVNVLIAGGDALQRPSLTALLPRLVDDHELAATSALSNALSNMGQLGGPALAGVVIAFAGLPAAYGIDLATFVVSLASLAAMRAVPPPADAERPTLRGVLDGFRYARSRQELIGSYVVDIAATFFGMPIALFPALAERLGGPTVLGLLYAAPSAGALIASGLSGWMTRIRRHGVAIAWAATGWGVAIVAFGLAHERWLALGALALAGGADEISGIFRQTLWNRTIPDELRGRLAGIELVSYSAGPSLSGIESGVGAQLAGIGGSVVAGGLLCVASVALLTAALPGFRHYRAAPPAEIPVQAGRVSGDPVVEVEG
jgi:hypothetical protein